PDEDDLVVAAATDALKDKDTQLRVEAALALARFARSKSGGNATVDLDRARRIATTLLSVLRDDQDVAVRASAATGLASICAESKKEKALPKEMPENDPLNVEALVAEFDRGLKNDAGNRLPLVGAIKTLGMLPMAAPPGLLAVLDDS